MKSSPGVVPVLVVLVHDVVHPVHQIGQQETVRPTDKNCGCGKKCCNVWMTFCLMFGRQI